MGLFRRKRDSQGADEMLRAYNAAEAARLADLTAGISADTAAPMAVGSEAGAGEVAVEDVFRITGRGLVATGKVSRGVVRIGDAVSVIRDGAALSTTEITGIEMFRKRANEARAGDMVGVLLAGKNDVARGDVIRVFASA
ncbi:EF-Tu/IF-2/RF-3 family GTPase [Microbacterium oxydans]|uniref:EF-Tu/IF-2/RF-3 family GTPase n=1 Tax=Microbacterium oxydans TaxID=82380 RepID=UPI0036735020